ncbi:hypothetical protein ILYODFUR_036304 [Ilyodon furcidens]|uniref:Uncharacterized protein n=1 Tax=Ilyodon furcidens TaxID=33524 RepID=A0ABV0UY45_9TELE
MTSPELGFYLNILMFSSCVLTVFLQLVRLSDLRGRLCFSGLSSELQPVASERVGPELQSSRRLRSEAAVGWTEGSTLETGSSQVWRNLLQVQRRSDRGGRERDVMTPQKSDPLNIHPPH